MKNHFKDHFRNLKRYQTSEGRDSVEGLFLDRNERVENFPPDIMEDIFRHFKPNFLNASPDANYLYWKIAAHLDIPREKIFIVSGITEGIRVLYETLTRPGDNVIVLDPTYPMYSVYAKMYQVEYRKFLYKSDLSPDLDSLYQNMDEKTTMVMIPNPNLPIESVFSIEEISDIAENCSRRGIVLVVDEAYFYFGAPTAIRLMDRFSNLVVMRSFSKAYGLAGVRLGFMVSAIENIEYLSKTRSLVESNTLSMSVAEYMIDHQEIRDAHVRSVKEGSNFLQSRLTDLSIRWFGGNVTNGILIFLDDEHQAGDLVSFLKERKIYIRGSFEAPYQNCVRVSLGPKEAMSRFMDSLKDWLGRTGNRQQRFFGG